MNNLYRLVLPLFVVVATPGLAFAAPLKVQPVGGENQCTTLCPHCNQPIAGARQGDYTIAFSADLMQAKTGMVGLYVRLTDLSGKPVPNAEVSIALSMPEHGHSRTVKASGGQRGRYTAITSLSTVMVGTWKADVQVKTPKGDTATQSFTFSR